MADYEITQFDFNIDPDDHLFVIGVVCEMVNIPIWTLRKLDEMGVVQPKRLGKKTRRYSKEQIKQLKCINYLMTVKKVNISGVKHFMEIYIGKVADED